MFCDGCGSKLQPGQAYCSGCGKQVVGPASVLLPRRRVRSHIQLVAIIWFAISALNAVIGIAAYIVANTVLVYGGPANAPFFVRPLVISVSFLILGGAALGFIAGWGLMHREPWARTLTLILAFFELFFNIPIGTAVGVYTLWVLLPGESEHEYDALVHAEAA